MVGLLARSLLFLNEASDDWDVGMGETESLWHCS